MMHTTPDLYAVMGNPIAHSLSPTLHEAFAQQTHQSIKYEKILVPLQGLTAAVKEFIQRGGKGLSITLPFKEDAFVLVDEVNEEARLSKAVNNILISSTGSLKGVNTDGIGLVRDITKNLKISLKGKSIVLLGAGGAVRGVLPALLREQPSMIVLVNRTMEKAKALASEFSSLGPVNAFSYEELLSHDFDVIINGTSASLHQEALPLPQEKKSLLLCYDMMYGVKENPFLQWGKNQNSKCLAEGIGMLIEQGAEIFYLWRGLHPDTQPLLRQFRG